MERLYAEALLWSQGFHGEERYTALLDELFLRDPANELYLQLEECSEAESLALLARWAAENEDFDADAFGAQLFAALEAAYAQHAATYDDLEEFGRRCYQLWHLLPMQLMDNEPFLTLAYGDDPLDRGDEGGARKLYEAAFAFYGSAAEA
ncbi:MAG: hypothetical protein IIW18_03695 [Oscillospiraceae bacterium]|nr:hypothetical protein [Oscillospiraceae bacterium]